VTPQVALAVPAARERTEKRMVPKKSIVAFVGVTGSFVSSRRMAQMIVCIVCSLCTADSSTRNTLSLRSGEKKNRSAAAYVNVCKDKRT